MSRDLILVSLALAAWGFGESMFLVFQPLYLQEMGASPLTIGAIFSGFGMAMAAAHIPAGYLSDRIGRRPMLWAAWILGIVSVLIMASASTLPVFVAGMLGYGVTAFALSPVSSYITAARGKWSVARALTLVSSTFSVGAIAGPWIGGRIGEQLGLRSVYWVAAVIFVVSSLLIFMVRPQPVERPPAAGRKSPSAFRPVFWIYLFVVFIAVFAAFLPQPLSANFLQNERGLNLAQIGLLGSMTSIGVVILNLVLGQLDARIGFFLGQAAAGFFALLLWQSSGMPGFALGFLLLGGYRTARSLAAAQARDLVHPARMGLAYGIIETVSSGAVILAPLLAGLLYERDPVSMYPAGLAFSVVALACSLGFFFLTGKPHRLARKAASVSDHDPS